MAEFEKGSNVSLEDYKAALRSVENFAQRVVSEGLQGKEKSGGQKVVDRIRAEIDNMEE